MVKSGAASTVADLLIKAGKPTGLTGIYIMVYLATVIFNAVVTNNAAAAVMFPIAYDVASEISGDVVKPMLFLLMMGASSDFMTPTGYQCNIMVYGPGGYQFLDYFRLGFGLQLSQGIVTIGVLITKDYWWVWSLSLLLILVLFAALDRKPYVHKGGSRAVASADQREDEKTALLAGNGSSDSDAAGSKPLRMRRVKAAEGLEQQHQEQHEQQPQHDESEFLTKTARSCRSAPLPEGRQHQGRNEGTKIKYIDDDSDC
jgi:hypothetical protein